MVHTVLGSSWLPAWFLSALGPGPSLRWIDAGGRFGATLPPAAGVRMARPRNAFQLEGMLAGLGDSADPVVLADPLALIYDEALDEAEAREAAERVARALRAVKGPCVVLAVARSAPPERGALGEAVLKASDRVVTLTEEDGPLSLEALGVAELALAAC